MEIKLVLSFLVLPSSRRERERERERERKREGDGGCLLYFYCITCIALMWFSLFILPVFNASSSLCHGMVCDL